MMPYNGMLEGQDSSAKGKGQASSADIQQSFSSAKNMISKIFSWCKGFGGK
nr:hypothetical protein HCAJSMRY_HCAJSMRY_CDS_0003 [Microvirus sp.]